MFIVDCCEILLWNLSIRNIYSMLSPWSYLCFLFTLKGNLLHGLGTKVCCHGENGNVCLK